MQLPQMVSALRRHLAVILATTLLGGFVGAGVQLSRPSGFVATIRMFANQGKANSTPVSQSPSLAVARMDTFVRLADSTALSERLVGDLSLDESAQSLSSRISASLDRDTVIMSVTVSGPSADEVREVAGAMPAAYTALANALGGVRSSDENATVFTTFDGPRVEATRSAKRVAAAVLLGLVVGGALAVAGVLARERRRSARLPAVLTTVTGLPVVGIVARRSRAEDRESWVGSLDVEQRLACHRLARNLPMLLTGDHRLVVVTAPRAPGDSASVALGVAAALAQRGERVLLVDAAAESSLALTVGVDVAPSTVDAAWAPAAVPALPGLELVTLAGGGAQNISGPDRVALRRRLSEARAAADIVVVDAVPVLSRSDVPTGIEEADAVLLVLDQYGTDLEDAVGATASVRAMTSAPAALVVHRAVVETVPSAQYLSGVVLPAAVPAPVD